MFIAFKLTTNIQNLDLAHSHTDETSLQFWDTLKMQKDIISNKHTNFGAIMQNKMNRCVDAKSCCTEEHFDIRAWNTMIAPH